MHVIGDELKKIIRKSQDELEACGNGLYIQAIDFRDTQISVDAIDLRIDNHGFVMNDEFEFVNTLSRQDFHQHFVRVELQAMGYDIKPGDTLYIGTLERVNLKGPYIGRVIGRSTYSRLGLSVNSSQDKFCGYNNAIIGLQIRNNTNQKIRIYPRQKLAQILIYKTEGVANELDSLYANETQYTIPTIGDKERTQYDENTANRIAEIIPKKKNFLRKLKDRKDASKIITVGGGVLVTSVLSINSIAPFSSNVKTAIVSVVVLFYIFMTLIALFVINDED